MHTAILYNDKGKSLGKKYYSYRKVSVLPNTVDINGSEYYKLALGDDYNEAYIKASNIDGTKRTLKRNAYVYATNKRYVKVVNFKWAHKRSERMKKDEEAEIAPSFLFYS